MEQMDLLSFKIISAVGTARSMYIEAIQEAKRSNFTAAQALMDEGAQLFLQGHAAHAGLIQQEARGEKSEYSLLLMHAEDLLISAESFRIVAEEFIDLYKRLG
ncbi:MAG: PTS lactose/cellobiose transporter subunit IIA [Erysipelotrichaceae bacterium]